MYPHPQPMNYGNNNYFYPPQQTQQQLPVYPQTPQRPQQQTQQQPMSVKVRYKDLIRRFTVPYSCTLDEFYQHLSKSFQMEIKSSTHLVNYKDNEDDMIVTTSEEEWLDAKNSFSTPCMQVSLKEKAPIQKPKDLLKLVAKENQPSTVNTAVTKETQPPLTSSPKQVSPKKVEQVPIVAQQQKQPESTLPTNTQTNPISNVQLSNPIQQTATVMNDSAFTGFVALNTSQQATPYSARFASDVNLPDNSAVYVNQQVTKIWKVVNPGSVTWPSNVQLHCRDSKTLPFEIVSSNVPIAGPNQSVEVSVTFIPRKVGPLKGFFKLCSGDIQFGHTFWLELNVHPIPVAEAPQQQQQTINQVVEQVRDLKIDDIKEFDSDDESDEDETTTTDFEDERFNALKEKYQFQLDVLGNMGMTNQKVLVNILDQNGGDITSTIQEFILLSSKMQ